MNNGFNIGITRAWCSVFLFQPSVFAIFLFGTLPSDIVSCSTSTSMASPNFKIICDQIENAWRFPRRSCIFLNQSGAKFVATAVRRELVWKPLGLEAISKASPLTFGALSKSSTGIVRGQNTYYRTIAETNRQTATSARRLPHCASN